MKILQILTIIVFISVIFIIFYFKSNNSNETIYICTENSKTDNQSYLFLTIQKSNFFTKLKNDSDGKVKYDITLDEKGVYNYIQKIIN